MFESQIYSAALQKLQGLGFPNARALALLMVAQAKHETNGFTSPVFKKNNNAFGYKYVKGAKYQLGAGSAAPPSEGRQPYAKYATVADSAREVAAWIGRRKKYFLLVNTKEQYARELKRQGYYGRFPGMTDEQSITNYLGGLKKYYDATIAPNTGGVAVALALAGVMFVVYKTLI